MHKEQQCSVQFSDFPGVNAYRVEGRGWVLSGDELNVVEFRGQHANIRCCRNLVLALSSKILTPQIQPAVSRPLLLLPLQVSEHAMHGSWHNAAHRGCRPPSWDLHSLCRMESISTRLSVLQSRPD